jgi:hypothetical protein
MTAVLKILLLAIGLAVAGAALAEGKKKLYRWTDETGKVHYTDQLPPEAAKSARDQLNDRGMAVDSVARAMTPEERAAYEIEQARLAEEQRRAEESAKLDSVLIGSYPSESDLARSYKERFELIERSIESAQVGIESQEKSLRDLLDHAANLERSGQPVPEGVVKSINGSRRQATTQRAQLDKRHVERATLQQEYDAVLERYRALTSDDA